MVLIIAKISSPFVSLTANIWVIINIARINIPSTSKEKNPIDDEITKNQKVNPAVTANDLNLGDESFILNRINECH